MKELLYLGVKLAASCVEAGYEKVKEDWKLSKMYVNV